MPSPKQRGAVAVAFALMLVPMLLMGGYGIDYLRLVNTRQSLQSVVDAAALAAAARGKNASFEEVRETITDYVTANAPATGVTGVSIGDPEIDAATNSISVTVVGTVDLIFMKVMAMASADVTVSSMARRPVPAPVQLALVLDTTFSMKANFEGKTRLDMLKAAANSLIDTLMPDDSTQNEVAIGIVPFNQYVNIRSLVPPPSPPGSTPSTPYPDWFDGSAKETYANACIEKLDPDCVDYSYSCTKDGGSTGVCWFRCKCKTWSYKDSFYQGCALLRKPDNHDDLDGFPFAQVTGSPVSCFSPPVLDLTKRLDTVSLKNSSMTGKAALKQSISDLYFYDNALTAETFIPGGLWWGWNMLTPGAPLTRAVVDDPATPTGLRNVMVLITDGANTVNLQPNGYKLTTPQANAPANALTETLCSGIKTAGITIYTIGFALADQGAIGVLRNCASVDPRDPDKPYAFTANSTDELNAAFQKIGTDLSELRLLN